MKTIRTGNRIPWDRAGTEPTMTTGSTDVCSVKTRSSAGHLMVARRAAGQPDPDSPRSGHSGAQLEPLHPSDGTGADSRKSRPGNRTTYCAIDLLYNRVRGRGSTVVAGPISGSPARASEWSGGALSTDRNMRQRMLISLKDPALSAALKPEPPEASKRCRKVLEQLQAHSGPRPADIAALAAAAWPGHMEVLMEIMSTIATAPHGKQIHGPNRQRWAMQLLLATTHVVGQALTTTTRWPRTWTHVNAIGAGKQVARPTLKNQQALFEYRAISGQWPHEDDKVAFWAEW